MTQGFQSSSANLEVVPQIEAKYPALLFKQQLTAYVEKIYRIVRDNLKNELSSPLDSCIQAPKTSEGNASQPSDGSTPAGPWHGIVDCLNNCFSTLKDNYVHPVLVQKIFTQTFSYINVQIFSSLLVNQECCTFSNGGFVKAGLAELEIWCGQATEEYAGLSWDELKHSRQAIGFLVIQEKSKISYGDLTNDICPGLSVQQLHRVCTLASSADDSTACVSADVISRMKEVMTTDASADNDTDINSIVLDDNSSIPVLVDDIISSIKVKPEDINNVKSPSELIEKEAFKFLQQ